jgi:hypothetical protein
MIVVELLATVENARGRGAEAGAKREKVMGDVRDWPRAEGRDKRRGMRREGERKGAIDRQSFSVMG